MLDNYSSYTARTAWQTMYLRKGWTPQKKGHYSRTPSSSARWWFYHPCMVCIYIYNVYLFIIYLFIYYIHICMFFLTINVRTFAIHGWCGWHRTNGESTAVSFNYCSGLKDDVPCFVHKKSRVGDKAP